MVRLETLTILYALLGNGVASIVPQARHMRHSRRQATHKAVEVPDYHAAEGSTPGATNNGSYGVLIEPDLVTGLNAKDGAHLKKIRMGPYRVPSGRMLPVPVMPFTPPCEDCYITAMQLNLEYPDGSRANVDTGAWCHHIDLTIPGEDITCPTNLMTVLTMQAPSMGGKRIFSNGNERGALRINHSGKYGLYLGNATLFGGVMEFMNENVNTIEVYLTLEFEWVPASTPGYGPAEMVWLDVTNCAPSSDFWAQPGKYNKKSREFVMPKDGDILSATAHLHDGGTNIELYLNGDLVCNSKTIYGNRRGHFYEPNNGTILPHMVMPPNSHISDVGHCKDIASFKKGDKLKVIAYYDGDLHPQMKAAHGHGGMLDMQMGIMYTYVGFKN